LRFALTQRLWRFVTALIVACVGITAAQPQSSSAASNLPPNFTVDSIAIAPASSGYGTVALASGNRIFGAEKRGVVRVWQNGVLQSQPFIDLSSEVNDFNERGLLGIAVHPNFPTQPYIYLYYTYDPSGVNADDTGKRVAVVARVTADSANPNVAVAGSRTILYGGNYSVSNGDAVCQSNGAYVNNCIPVEMGNHANGRMQFGSDGMLYLDMGDSTTSTSANSKALRAQDLNIPLGKILRIDPANGQGLSNNPFYDGNPDSNRSRVYSYGLRNPFSFTLHPTNGQIYIADVGWNEWEELNVGKGKNFGWPCYEGDNNGNAQQPVYASEPNSQAQCSALYAQSNSVTAPALAYDHFTGSSIIAGAFYNSSVYPSQYQGAMFIADYGSPWIKYVTFDANNKGTLNNFLTESNPPTQVLRGLDGNIYYVVYLSSSNSYELRRIRYTGAGNQAPFAVIGASPTSGAAPLTVNFNGSASSDPEGQALTYTWTFGDGSTSRDANPTHTYTAGGTYNVTLVVKDSAGASSPAATTQINVNNSKPVLNISAPAANLTYNVGDVIAFSGSASDAEDGDLSGSIQWTGILHHDVHTHPNWVIFTGASSSFTVPDHGDNSYIELCASVMDSAGLSSGQQCRTLQPNLANYTFDTVPSGLSLSYGGVSRITPFTVQTIVNSTAQLVAPDVQGSWAFASWSDGGARTHTVVVQSANRSFTAYYNAITTATATARPTATATSKPATATATATSTATRTPTTAPTATRTPTAIPTTLATSTPQPQPQPSATAIPSGRTCTVSPQGWANFTRVQAAINDATCSTITVYQGTYVENLIIDRSIILKGQLPSNTILDGGALNRVIEVRSGNVSISNLTVRNGKVADTGAGVWVQLGASVTLNRIALTNNAALLGGAHNLGTGGAIANSGAITVLNTLIANNTAQSMGGGIWSNGRTLIIANSTLANNRADVLGGALHVEGNVDTPVMDLRVLNSTFANNSVASGVSGAAIDYLNPTASALTLVNTIVGANGSASCRGPITNGGNNLDADGSCGIGPATDPLLDPIGLKDNGGPTATIALRASSPAIDTAQPAICSGPLVNKVDQRGEGRPKDGDGIGLAICDIGAYEAPWVTRQMATILGHDLPVYTHVLFVPLSLRP